MKLEMIYQVTTKNMLLFFCLGMIVGALGPVSGQEWSGRQALDPEGVMSLAWRNQPDRITMQLVGKTVGYVGLGFSPNGNMVDADLVIGWVKDGKAFLKDAYSVSNSQPEIDVNQNYNLIPGESTENGTHTQITFSRQLKTGDPKDKDIQSGQTTLIYCYHESDPVDENKPPYHGVHPNRGAVRIKLL